MSQIITAILHQRHSATTGYGGIDWLREWSEGVDPEQRPTFTNTAEDRDRGGA
jgi:hypothetical protein